ncbi:MAG: hypothetical protein AABX53_00830 [Nanoarchaeota archaeon]
MYRPELVYDAHGNPLGTGLFYLGPDPVYDVRAQLYFTRGWTQIEGVTAFIAENSRGEEIPLDALAARQLYPASDEAINTALNAGRVSIENEEWFKKRSRKTVRNNRIVEP